MTQEELAVIHNLITAIHDNRADDLRKILNGNRNLLTFSWMQGNPNGRAKEMFTPLSYAVSRFNFDAVKIMIEEFSADPNLAAEDGATPLHIAAFHDKDPVDENSDAYKTVRYLLDKGANPDIQTQSKIAPGRTIRTPRALAIMKTAHNCHTLFNPPQESLVSHSYFSRENLAVAAGVVATVAGVVFRTMMKP